MISGHILELIKKEEIKKSLMKLRYYWQSKSNWLSFITSLCMKA